MASTLALLALALTILALTHAYPPGPNIKCTSGTTKCTLTNFFGAYPDRSVCWVSAVAFPSDETEVLCTVSDAFLRQQHMKVVTRYTHSMPKLSCPGGPDGSGLLISTKRLNRVVAVDLPAARITIEAGITLRELLDAAAEHGLALAHSPYWLGLTLGGLLATGAHGSSMFGKGAAVHEYVVGVRLVVPSARRIGGYNARVVKLEEGDADLLAAKLSLGVLGVITQVTIQLDPMFKRSVTNRIVSDAGFEQSVASFAATTEYGDITWYPSQAIVVYKDDNKVPISTPGNGVNDLIAFRATPTFLAESARAVEDLLQATGNAEGICLLAKQQVQAQLAAGTGFKNNNGSLVDFSGYPVIGNQSDMQASGSCLISPDDNLLTACGWDPRIRGTFFHQTTVSITFADIAHFIADVKKLHDIRPEALCGVELYIGFHMRFVRNSTAYLGKTEDSVDVDIIYYRPRDPGRPRLHEDVLEEIEQTALFKYRGLPHWGKNRNIGFVGMRDKLGKKRWRAFSRAMAKYDEKRLFSSDWTDAVLGLRGREVVVRRNGCALEGLCVCSADRHCAPEKGYYCRPGYVYAEARVCRKI